jgi:hypothetical protein
MANIEDTNYLYENSIIEHKNLLIDSNHRDKLLFPNSGDFAIILEEPIKNVVNMKLLDASIPNSFLTVDCNNNILYTHTGYGGSRKHLETKTVVDARNYTLEDLITPTAMENTLSYDLNLLGFKLSSISESIENAGFVNYVVLKSNAPFRIDSEQSTLKFVISLNEPIVDTYDLDIFPNKAEIGVYKRIKPNDILYFSPYYSNQFDSRFNTFGETNARLGYTTPGADAYSYVDSSLSATITTRDLRDTAYLTSRFSGAPITFSTSFPLYFKQDGYTVPNSFFTHNYFINETTKTEATTYDSLYDGLATVPISPNSDRIQIIDLYGTTQTDRYIYNDANEGTIGNLENHIKNKTYPLTVSSIDLTSLVDGVTQNINLLLNSLFVPVHYSQEALITNNIAERTTKIYVPEDLEWELHDMTENTSILSSNESTTTPILQKYIDTHRLKTSDFDRTLLARGNFVLETLPTVGNLRNILRTIKPMNEDNTDLDNEQPNLIGRINIITGDVTKYASITKLAFKIINKHPTVSLNLNSISGFPSGQRFTIMKRIMLYVPEVISSSQLVPRFPYNDYVLIGPTLTNFINTKYLKIFCRELESRIDNISYSNTRLSPGLAVLGTTINPFLNYNNTVLSHYPIEYKEFKPPINKLKQLSFFFTDDKNELVDFKGLEFYFMLQIDFRTPIFATNFTDYKLNPNYKRDFLEYMRYADEREERMNVEGGQHKLVDYNVYAHQEQDLITKFQNQSNKHIAR